MKSIDAKSIEVSSSGGKPNISDPLSSADRMDEIDILEVKEIILTAHEDALEIIRNAKMLDELNKFIFDHFRRSSKTFGHASRMKDNDQDTFEFNGASETLSGANDEQD